MDNTDKTNLPLFHLAGRYQMLEVIAEGGMSVLYAAIDSCTGRNVAIKLMRQHDLKSADRRKRFEQEIRTTTLLRHPNIVTVIDSGVDPQGVPYLVMERLRGRSLEEELALKGTIPVEEVLRWFVPLMGALAHSHDRRIVHRDIKPSNIFLAEQEQGDFSPKLLDFGIAMMSDITRITKSGIVVGTVQYMSPEQATGAELGSTTDVWSMAAVLFRCLAGRAPFEANTAANLLLKIVQDPVPSLTSYATDIGPQFAATIDRALQKDLRLRYSNMRSFARILCLGARAEGIVLPQEPDSIGLPQWSRWCSADITDDDTTANFPIAIELDHEEQSGGGDNLARSLVSSLPGHSQTEFVGRHQELHGLDEQLALVGKNAGNVVGIVGPAGIGKSRVFLEWRRRLTGSSTLFLEGRCQPQGEIVSFALIRQIIQAHFHFDVNDEPRAIKQVLIDGLGVCGGEMASFAGFFFELFGLPQDDDGFKNLVPKEKRDRIFEAIASLMIRISQKQPLIIVIEDAHWIDKSSEEFFDYFVRLIENHQVLVVFIYRNEYQPFWVRSDRFTEIRVDRLQYDTIHTLVQSILRSQTVSSELVEFIEHRSRGNPLFVEELTQVLLESNLIQQQDGRFILDPRANSISLPQTVQGVIAERIDRLENKLKRTLQMAAVIGPNFASNILQAISDMREELWVHLSSLRSRELISYQDSPFEGNFSFKHSLTRDAAYQTQLGDRRRESHQKTAEAIESMYHERAEDFLEALAYHYYNAESWSKAYRYSKLSGIKAWQNYSNWEAVRFFEQAIRALQHLPPDEQNKRMQVELRYILDKSLSVLGYPEGAIENLKKLEQLAKELADTRSLIITYVRMNTIYCHRGKPLEERVYTEQGFEQAWNSQDIELIATTSFGLCETYSLSGDYYRMVDFVPPVITLLEDAGRKAENFGWPLNVYSYLCTRFAISLAILGRFKESRRYCEKSLKNALKIGELSALGCSQSALGVYWLAKGNAERSIEHALKGIEYFRQSEWFWVERDLMGVLARAYEYAGDIANGLKFARQAFDAQDETTPSMIPCFPAMSLSFLYYRLNDYYEARYYADLALTISRQRGDKFGEGLSRQILGRILEKTSKEGIAEALQELALSIDLLERAHSRPLVAVGHVFIGEVYLNHGELAKGITEIKQAENTLVEIEEEYWIKEARRLLGTWSK